MYRYLWLISEWYYIFKSNHYPKLCGAIISVSAGTNAERQFYLYFTCYSSGGCIIIPHHQEMGSALWNRRYRSVVPEGQRRIPSATVAFRRWSVRLTRWHHQKNVERTVCVFCRTMLCTFTDKNLRRRKFSGQKIRQPAKNSTPSLILLDTWLLQ